ncbi:MAG: HPr family phosphocarrier protein [Spirochaetales bacterium]|nr:HPr family phosphocarrier protein [Spirochaetales bacterium]
MRNAAGIHVRPAGVIAEAFCNYPGKITLEAHEMRIELRNVLGLLALGLKKGDTVKVRVEGPREKMVCSELAALLERNFDFPPRN